ncbi:MAG TPA: hypothetical protein VFV78_04360 [Vicinamibacterales bacterium]|nr:hypothetical protein [Vicinamibacterales bacterium]
MKAVFVLTGLVTTVGGPPPKAAPTLPPFISNGCSVFPDGNAYGCCYVHDFSYWVGGTQADRRRADRALEQCVADVTGNPVIGNDLVGNHVVGGLMYVAVSLFGLPGVPTRVNWGYGWGDTRQTSYAALTPNERSQAEARKQEACRTFTRDSGTGRYMIDSVHWLRESDARQLCPALPGSPARRSP